MDMGIYRRTTGGRKLLQHCDDKNLVEAVRRHVTWSTTTSMNSTISTLRGVLICFRYLSELRLILITHQFDET